MQDTFNKTFSGISCWSTLNKSSINECSLQLHTFHKHVETILVHDDDDDDDV